MQSLFHASAPCFGSEKANVTKVLKVKNAQCQSLQLTVAKCLTAAAVPVHGSVYQYMVARLV